MKALTLVLASCALGLCADPGVSSHSFTLAKSGGDAPLNSESRRSARISEGVDNIQAGSYLASRFAQNRHDWGTAEKFVEKLVQSSDAQEDVLVRAMVLAMGSGDAEKAFDIAHKLNEQGVSEQSRVITEIFLIIDLFDKNQYAQAQAMLKAMPADGTVQFIGPFINAWLEAAQGRVEVNELRANIVQLYHGILISDYLNNHMEIEKIIGKALKVDDIQVTEIERIADLYGHIGMDEKALELYGEVLKKSPDDGAVKTKVELLKGHKNKPLFKKIETARGGMAQAFYDIGNILFNENNDESARIFAHIALHLSPKKSDTVFLLAKISERNKQYSDAISYYKSIPQSDERYVEAQHDIADIYDKNGRYDEALELLRNLAAQSPDVDTIIKEGDIYRRKNDFKQALMSYDAAVQKLGGSIPPDYWHVHYVRGIAYEQSDNWQEAEKELKAALAYQPDHPYVLNYLGYAWADQGVHLDQALEMIRRAVNLRPSDGYITDSLGWVMFRTGDYKGAANVLEKAVELLPYDPTVNDHLGDAYWMVGRRLEARFQWERAKNNSEDPEQIQTLEQKLLHGLSEKLTTTQH